MEELERVRQETMKREDVQKVINESNSRVETAERNASRILETNKLLVAKMKSIKHLLTEQDKKLMDQTDRTEVTIC